VLETAADFKFSLKLPREITHQKNLKFNPTDVDRFLELINGMGEKQGCLLVQFPASITEDFFEHILTLLTRIRRKNRSNWKVAVEFRHDSWYAEHVYKMLLQQKAALVIHDKRKSKTPVNDFASDVVYLRLHGPHGDYRGTYTNDLLSRYAGQISLWLAGGKTVYCYFNNTIGTAFHDARLLRLLCSQQQLVTRDKQV
jgi:uncharacterized protein YecE (DUF72 family)